MSLAHAPRAVIVVTGSELVRGDRRDANGPFLASSLVRLGLDPARILVVGDRPEELEAAIREGLQADICVTSGGLGPTHDDRTIEMLARMAERGLEADPELERQIEAVSRTIAERVGRPYADFEPGVRKQALLPQGGVAIGLAGTAPAVLLAHDGRVAVALPGPPSELRRLWPEALARPELRDILRRVRPREHRVLRFFGPSESTVARALDESGGEGIGLEITVCARDFEIHVDLFSEAGAERERDDVEQALRTEFGDQLFAEDERPVEQIVLELARERGLTLATAESCTGGLVATRLTDMAGASDVFLGGFVAYANAVKEAQLAVSPETLTEHGAVSAETAEAMAQGARMALGADIALAITGVAGPGGGTREKPVGLVFVHVESPESSEALRRELPGDREAVRARAASIALHLLRRVLSQSIEHPA